MATVFRHFLPHGRKSSLTYYLSISRCYSAENAVPDGGNKSKPLANNDDLSKVNQVPANRMDKDGSAKGENMSYAELQAPREYRFIFPEFIPTLNPQMRHAVREKLERMDMLNRRRVMEIPEFYVGSLMAVTASDRCAPGKTNRFVGICIQRSGEGLRAFFILRNVVDNQGVEIMYEMYNPSIQKIEVLKLEKRLDDELIYLRDAPAEYSTFSFDTVAVLHPEGEPVPVNPLKVMLKPRPWFSRWERFKLKGAIIPQLTPKHYARAEYLDTPWDKYDLMKEYRSVIPEEEQQEIYAEVYAQEKELAELRKKEKRKIQRVQPRKL